MRAFEKASEGKQKILKENNCHGVLIKFPKKTTFKEKLKNSSRLRVCIYTIQNLLVGGTISDANREFILLSFNIRITVQ